MHPTPEVSALPDPHLTLYVLLAGVMGGLVLAVVVMVCCKVCLKKKKPLQRQQVVFSRSSERQHSRARKYHSLDSSVSVDIETSWGGMSDGSPSPREPKEFCPPEEGPRFVPPFASVSPRSLPDIPESKTPEEDQKCVAGPSQPKRVSDPLSGRRRSSAGIQRQASVCLSDEDDDASLYQVEHKESRDGDERRSVKVDGGDKSVLGEDRRSPYNSPRGTPPTPPSVSSVSFHPHKTPHYTSTTQTHTAVVHRNGDMNLNNAGRSPDRNSQCSCCRNSRGSQGSHSHNSSVDSGSTRTVIAVNDHSYGVVSVGGGSSVSNGFSNGENDDSKHLKTFAEEEDDVGTTTAKSSTPTIEETYEREKVVKRRSSNGPKKEAKTPNGETGGMGSCPTLRLSREVHSSSSLDAAASGEGWAEIPASLREAASTEKGLLERALELHQEETRRRLKTLQRPESDLDANSGDEDSEAKRPVRYNDTGSREEIREEELSGISPSPPTTSESEIIEEELEDMEDGTDYESLRDAYRQLWELRATFEEEEELSDTLRFDEDEEDEEEEEEETDEKGIEESEEVVEECTADEDARSGTPGVTPEREPSSQATSFESNTEPCAQDDENETGNATKSSEASSGEKKEETEAKILSNLLSLPTTESRRSSFTSRMGRRLKRSRPPVPGGSDGLEGSAATGTSFDSVETEWSSTEASRTGEDQSTSFESTTTTDSSATESLQARRLQQMKADSGYKSMESNGRRPPKLSRGKPMMRSTVDSISIDELDEGKVVCESLVISRAEQPSAVILIGKDVTAAMVERSKSASALKKRLQPWKDWPPPAATTTTLHVSTSTSPGMAVISPVKATVTAVVVPSTTNVSLTASILSSKSEDAAIRVPTSLKGEIESDRISGGGLSPSPSTTSSIASDLRGKISVFQRFFRSSRPSREERMARDFSIDEKSDSLFREFSRQDPSLEATESHRCRSSASWRQSHSRLHHSHPYHHSHPPHHGLVHHHSHPPPHQHHAPLPVHHHHHHHHSHGSHATVSGKWSEMREDVEMVVLGGKGAPAFSPQLSIDEESSGLEGGGSRPLSRSGVSERSLALQDIPVIRLPASED